jgi:dihydroorotase
MKTIYFKNAHFWSPEGIRSTDLLIQGEYYQLIDGKNKAIQADQVYDLQGKLVCPGFIDMQVHFREPGFEYKEDLKSGTNAALKGGFVSVATMPNTAPVLDRVELLKQYQYKLDALKPFTIIPVMAMTKGLKGEELANYKQYRDIGIVAITDDGIGVEDDNVMEQIFEKAATYGLSILQHCEYKKISHLRPVHASVRSASAGVQGSESASEWKMVERDLNLLRKHGGHYHVLHTTCKESVELIRKAKSEGLNVTAEVTPHHLVLTEKDIPWNRDNKTNYKMNPPLRGQKDREALIKGLADGIIDIVSTDHAPHSKEEKNASMEQAPFGVIGLETAFPILYSELVLKKKITLDCLIKALSSNVWGIFPSVKRKQQEATFTIIDLEKSQKIDDHFFNSKSHNSPFYHRIVKGNINKTIIRGQIMFQEGEGSCPIRNQ